MSRSVSSFVHTAGRQMLISNNLGANSRAMLDAVNAGDLRCTPCKTVQNG